MQTKVLSEKPATMSPKQWIYYLENIATRLLGDCRTPQEKFEQFLIRTPSGGQPKR